MDGSTKYWKGNWEKVCNPQQKYSFVPYKTYMFVNSKFKTITVSEKYHFNTFPVGQKLYSDTKKKRLTKCEAVQVQIWRFYLAQMNVFFPFEVAFILLVLPQTRGPEALL